MSIQSNINNILSTQAKFKIANKVKNKFDYEPVNANIKQMTEQRINDIKKFKKEQQLRIKYDPIYYKELEDIANRKVRDNDGKK